MSNTADAPQMPHWTEPAPEEFAGIPEGNYPKPVIDAPKVGEVAATHVEVKQVGDDTQDVPVSHPETVTASK